MPAPAVPGATMPTYVHLISFTREGLETILDGPDPAPGATAERFGGELLADYLTLGRYDVVSVTSFPDDASAARFLLEMARGGQFRSETLRAFDTDAFHAILAGLEG